jgi:hypothetical protein
MIPFFVLDRPNALALLGKAITTPAMRFGIMTHARVSERFVRESDALRKRITERFGFTPSLIVDSGAFTKNHAPITESELFIRYERMGASYGVVNDILGDYPGTVQNCSKAMAEYLKSRRKFNLVGVTQGQCIAEYLACYNELARMGYRHIAIGGLLQKKPRSIRFTQVKSQEFMREVLSAIRSEFNPKWLYVLGAYHPQRHESFRELGVWGSDYKGWLFRYPTIFQGFLTLSQVASESGMPPSEVRRIKRTQCLIKRYRYCDDQSKAILRRRIKAFHAELWRSQAIVKLLLRENLPRKEHRLLQAVFWESAARRREAGILDHLRKDIFTLLIPNERKDRKWLSRLQKPTRTADRRPLNGS